MLDPPKFAPTAAHAERASRAYKDINLLALKMLAPGGLLLTFSCSGGVSADLFQKIVAGAALDAGADAQILRRLDRQRRPSGRARVPGRRLPEGPRHPQALTGARGRRRTACMSAAHKNKAAKGLHPRGLVSLDRMDRRHPVVFGNSFLR